MTKEEALSLRPNDVVELCVGSPLGLPRNMRVIAVMDLPLGACIVELGGLLGGMGARLSCSHIKEVVQTEYDRNLIADAIAATEICSEDELEER